METVHFASTTALSYANSSLCIYFETNGTIADRLASARRHVIEGRRIIANQRALIERLKSSGRDASEAERTLDAFRRSLAIFEEHLADRAEERRGQI